MNTEPVILLAWTAWALAVNAAEAPLAAPSPTKVKTEAKSDWWSFKPVSHPPLPSVKNTKWARNPIDLFILAKLEQEKLGPSPEADRRTLIRRLSFDLTGLPPTPAEVERFRADRGPQAYEKLVDNLLASPRYGERWARHWLDTVHFADTHGYDKDKVRPNAWPYRDYVIRSLNQDKPYSRFVEEQLAGDVLFPDEPDGVVALGFIAAGPWDYVGHVELPIEKTDGLIARYNDRDDMVMTTMSTFQSLTAHCARCHDHKFDPISQKDYYSLQAVFAGVDRHDRDFDSEPKIHAQRRRLAQQRKPLQERFFALTNQIAGISSPEIKALDDELEQLKKQMPTAFPADEKSPGNGYHSKIEKAQDPIKWVQIDLGKSLPLEEIRLIPARPIDFPDTPGFGFPVRFRIDASDEADFTSAQTIADQTREDFKNVGDNPVSFLARERQARFVRITATRLWERTSDYVFALAELQVLVSGTNAALGATVSALDSIEEGFWAKKYLVDGFDSRHRLGVPTSAAKKKLEEQMRGLAEKRRSLVDALTDEATRRELTEVSNQWSELNRQIAALPTPSKVYAAANDFKSDSSFLPAKAPRPVYVLAKGDVKRPGQLMQPAGLPAVPGPNPDLSTYLGETIGHGDSSASSSPSPSTLRSTATEDGHPSPSGRGGTKLSTDDFQTASPSPIDGQKFSLSPGERAGVRGKSAAEHGSDLNGGEMSGVWNSLDEGARRAALAKWITDPKNMLTRRSLVNRVWGYHFGHGLVDTPNDFGHMGALPAHPELLDWLAFWFLEHGESLKQLHRLILTSATYRQSSASNPQGARLDADNRYLWRMNRARLDAESIHDSMLLISGKLDLTMGGPALRQFYFKDDHSPLYDYTLFDVDSPASCRRSIYRFLVRSVPDPLMDSLDCPNASLLTPKRNVTTTSLQALAMLNDPFVLKQCEHFATRLSKAGDLKEQIHLACQLALNRRPTSEETRRFTTFARKHGLVNLCRLIFNTSEFMFVD